MRHRCESKSRAIAAGVLVGAGLCVASVGARGPHGGAHVSPAVPQPDVAGPMAVGTIVSEIDSSCWVVFQDKDDNYWFGSDGRGECRYDGKTLTRFTTVDGLSHDQVRGIQQHAPTGDILITTNGGVSKFDGERFVTLPITEMKAPRSATPGDGGSSEGWVLNADDVWLTGSGGPRRYDGTTLYQLKFFESVAVDENVKFRWNPYDVWTVYTDRRGQKWFGTGGNGVCRFDGRSLDWMYEAHLTEIPGGGWFGFRSIIEGQDGDFWICSTQYRFKFEPHGVAGQESGKLVYTRETGMYWSAVNTPDTFIHFQSVTQDTKGDLWMAPYAGGIWRHDGTKGTHYPMMDGDNEITMFTIYKDNHGGLWVGTHEYGAYTFNGAAFERFRP